MNKIIGYVDLNIPIGPGCEAVARTAINLGFRTLAINTPILAKDFANNRNSKKGGGGGGKKRKWEDRSGGLLASTAAEIGKGQRGQDGLPPPPFLPWLNVLVSENPGTQILQRLTVIFSEIHQLQTVLSHPNAKSYDILAVLPTNHDALTACLTSTAVVFDILAFDFEGPHWIQKLRINRQKGDLAAGKEIHFELTTASALHGDEPLENLIYTAHSLIENVCVKRIKNLILTSGAGTPLEVRAPKDLVSLGFLLSLDDGTTRVSLRDAPNRIIQKTEARKYGKTWVAFIPAEKVADAATIE